MVVNYEKYNQNKDVFGERNCDDSLANMDSTLVQFMIGWQMAQKLPE